MNNELNIKNKFPICNVTATLAISQII
jgi:hypothetical protein